MNEFIDRRAIERKVINKGIEIKIVNFAADGMQTQFSVGETISVLFSVTTNGLLQRLNTDYYHIASTSKITFEEPPLDGSTVSITYYKNKSTTFIDNYGKPLFLATEYFDYDGTTLIFNVANAIKDVVSLDINGLVEEEGIGYDITSNYTVTLNYTPVIGSKIGVTYLY
jgi:hypothetical protein